MQHKPIYVGTVSGKLIDLNNVRQNQIDIWDIATGLANICRFGGQIDTPYSVAQHSIRVMRMVPAKHRLDALMHDAAEYLIGDIVGPFKYAFDELVALEKRIYAPIAAKWGLSETKPFVVDWADKTLTYYEERELRKPPYHIKMPHYKYTPDYFILPKAVPHDKARDIFITLFDQLMRERYNAR